MYHPGMSALEIFQTCCLAYICSLRHVHCAGSEWSTSCAKKRESAGRLPVSCRSKWHTTSRAWSCPWVWWFLGMRRGGQAWTTWNAMVNGHAGTLLSIWSARCWLNRLVELIKKRLKLYPPSPRREGLWPWKKVFLPLHRDATSGGIVRVYPVKPSWVVVISEQDKTKAHEMLEEGGNWDTRNRLKVY